MKLGAFLFPNGVNESTYITKSININVSVHLIRITVLRYGAMAEDLLCGNSRSIVSLDSENSFTSDGQT